MPYKCCVVACKSGYDGQRTPEGVTFHKFPDGRKEAEMLKKWCRGVKRDSFDVKPTMRVCSLHFAGDDYNRTSSDSNKWRDRPSTTLKRPQLRKDAVPRFHPNLPPYHSAPKTPRRSEKLSVPARAQRYGIHLNFV